MLPATTTGNITAGDITASRSATEGLIFLGSGGTKYLHFNGTNYVMPSARLVLNGSYADNFASGTRMVFAQAAAPTNWTQVTDDSANNRMLRVVSGGGAGIGGSDDPTYNNKIPDHTHYVNLNSGGQSADHSHGVGTWYASTNVNYGHVCAGGQTGVGTAQSNGSSNDHYHNVQGWANWLSASNPGVSVGAWSARYINMIICQKN